jgi:hypothetical protein
MRPRLVEFSEGIIDANQITAIWPVRKKHENLFAFHISTTGNNYIPLTSSDESKLEAIRQKLIKFVWPNADILSF